MLNWLLLAIRLFIANGRFVLLGPRKFCWTTEDSARPWGRCHGFNALGCGCRSVHQPGCSGKQNKKTSLEKYMLLRLTFVNLLKSNVTSLVSVLGQQSQSWYVNKMMYLKKCVAECCCNSAPVHGGESWPGGQDRVGPWAGRAPRPGRRHQDVDGQDNLPDGGFTAAQPR